MNLALTCIIIFLARIADVSLGSLRIILLGKGKAKLAFLFGFLEIFVWFIVAKDALNQGNNWWIVFSYCIGYAAGTYIGSMINEHFVGGQLGVQVVTSNHNYHIIEEIRKKGFAVSTLNIEGKDKSVSKYMLFIEIDKMKFDDLKKIVHQLDPKAFLVVSETKYVQNGYFK